MKSVFFLSCSTHLKTALLSLENTAEHPASQKYLFCFHLLEIVIIHDLLQDQSLTFPASLAKIVPKKL